MLQRLIRKKEFSIIVIVVVLSAVIQLTNSVFLRPDNIVDVLKSNAVIGIMALGMLPVMITGGINVSIPATIALCAVISAKLIAQCGMNMVLALLVSMCVGGAVGVINGLLISRLKMPPIVATLGTNAIVLGGVLYWTNGAWVTNMPDDFRAFGTFAPLGVPVQVIIFLVMCLITAWILFYTLIGRSVYGLGGSESSAIRVGFNVDHTILAVYTYSGVMVGLAAWVYTSILQQVDPNSFGGMDMDVIACVVIGGASTMGGSGSVFGTFLGIVMMAIINNGLILMHIPTYWQDVVVGLVIVVAVSVDILNRNRAQSRIARVDVAGEEEPS